MDLFYYLLTQQQNFSFLIRKGLGLNINKSVSHFTYHPTKFDFDVATFMENVQKHQKIVKIPGFAVAENAGHVF